MAVSRNWSRLFGAVSTLPRNGEFDAIEGIAEAEHVVTFPLPFTHERELDTLTERQLSSDPV